MKFKSSYLNEIGGPLPWILALTYLMLFYSTFLPAQTSLRFFGNGVNAPDQDRVKILVYDVNNGDPGPPVDVGNGDFTIEFWIKCQEGENGAAAINCGNNINWINGNIILDRDRYNQQRKFGVSLGAGLLAFGVSTSAEGNLTLCGTTDLRDNTWHHVAVQRRFSDGFLWLFIDGQLQNSADGPDGDISYPDDGTPCGNCCGGNNCNHSDPYLVIGAEKHDAGSQYPSYSGFFDELRISNTIRYTANFAPAQEAYATDASTMGLYHFDEGFGIVAHDESLAVDGPSPGMLKVGGNPEGPIWISESPVNCLAGTTNNWVGPSLADWHANASNWSLSRLPGTRH